MNEFYGDVFKTMPAQQSLVLSDLAISFPRRSRACSRHPSIVVMQATEYRKGEELSCLSRLLRRLSNGSPLVDALMRAAIIEKQDIFVQYGSQVSLSEDDDVIEALAPYAAEEALADRVHQWGPHSGLRNADARTLCHAVELSPELAVPVANDRLRTMTEGRELTKLLGGPAFAWFARHGDVHDLSRVYIDNKQGE